MSSAGPEPTSARRRRLGLAGLLGTMAVAHVVVPKPFLAIIPDWAPGDPRTLNLLAAVAEGSCAALLSSRRTARWGGYAALGTFVAVYPANVQMALDGGAPGVDGPLGSAAVAWARLPLQFPLFWWARKVALEATATRLSEVDRG